MASISSISSVSFPWKSDTIPKPTLSSSSFHGLRMPNSFPNLFSSASSARASSVVMMAKKQEELNEIRQKPTEELNDEIVDLKGELFMLRLNRSARNDFKSSEFRRMRKRVLSQFPFHFSYFFSFRVLLICICVIVIRNSLFCHSVFGLILLNLICSLCVFLCNIGDWMLD